MISVYSGSHQIKTQEETRKLISVEARRLWEAEWTTEQPQTELHTLALNKLCAENFYMLICEWSIHWTFGLTLLIVPVFNKCVFYAGTHNNNSSLKHLLQLFFPLHNKVGG